MGRDSWTPPCSRGEGRFAGIVQKVRRFRIVDEIDREKRMIKIFTIGHRREIFEFQISRFDPQRILPEGWVAFTRAPASVARDRQYGAHFWLRIPEEYQCGNGSRRLPADAFHAVGYEGQFVTVIPSRELVLVRLGLARDPCAWDHQVFVDLMLRAFENDKPANPALQGTRQETVRP
jgi:CubicO group peptidase (beta-lactamase class C family)